MRSYGRIMNLPSVSVVITTAGRPSVRAAALSALDQTCAPLEVIVVVDTVEGHVPSVLCDIASSIRVFFTGGIGANGARMRGVMESRGRVIAFLDDDDVWLPEKLERQLAVLRAALSIHQHALVS